MQTMKMMNRRLSLNRKQLARASTPPAIIHLEAIVWV